VPRLWALLMTKWIKSSFSGPTQNCVEMQRDGKYIAVRDSKDPNGYILLFTELEMTAFIKGVKNGEFDQFTSSWVTGEDKE
jgi:hypothetical protein